jgi:hypothetical protein
MPPTLRERITRTVLERTGRRIDNLHVEVTGERVVLRGRAGSFHVKQLALSGVRDVLPDAPLRNEICVA